MIENYRLEDLNEQLHKTLDYLADMIANPQEYIDENDEEDEQMHLREIDCQKDEIQAIAKDILSLVAYNQGQAKIAEKLLKTIPNPMDISNLEVETSCCGTTMVRLDGKDVSSYWPGHYEGEKLTNYVSMLNS
jgi:hypothetical protein